MNVCMCTRKLAHTHTHHTHPHAHIPHSHVHAHIQADMLHNALLALHMLCKHISTHAHLKPGSLVISNPPSLAPCWPVSRREPSRLRSRRAYSRVYRLSPAQPSPAQHGYCSFQSTRGQSSTFTWRQVSRSSRGTPQRGQCAVRHL